MGATRDRAALTASSSAPARPSARRRVGPAQPPEWLWLVSIMLQVLIAAVLTAYTYFFIDDWLFIAEARRLPLSLSYLRKPLYEHFSPISRLLDKLLVGDTTGSFALAHDLQLVMYAAAIAAFAFVVRTILGNQWPAFFLTILFGQSLFLIRLLNWWTATANILPATVFSLIAFGAYLRWWRSRSFGWLIVCLACFLVALLDYENAMLLPLYILTVSLLVLADDSRPRRLNALRSEWSIWLGFLVLDVCAAVNYYTGYYLPLPHATVGQTLHYLAIAVFSSFIPALFGIKHPESALGRQPLVIVACVTVFLMLAAYLLYTRPRTWRCMAAFLLIAVITLAPVGIDRIPVYRLHVADELYYAQSLQFMFLILVALALRAERRRAPPRQLVPILTWLRAAPVAAATLVLAALAGYGVLYVISVDAMADASWQPHRSRAYVSAFQASVRRVIRQTGRPPVLFNATVPVDIGGRGTVPYNRYDDFFPIVDSRVRFNTVTTPMYVVSPAGALFAVRFVAADAGTVARATVLEKGSPALPTVTRGGYLCVPAGRNPALVRVPLVRMLRLTTTSGQLPPALRLLVRTPTATSIKVTVTGPATSPAGNPYTPHFRPGASGQYIPLDVGTEARAIDLELPARSCIGSLAIGSFSLPPQGG